MTEGWGLAAAGIAGIALAVVIGVLFWINAGLREDKAVLERNVVVLQGAVSAGETALREMRAAAQRADAALEEWINERNRTEKSLEESRREIRDLRRSDEAVALWLDGLVPDFVHGVLGQDGNGARAASHPGENTGGSAPSDSGAGVAGEDQRGSLGLRQDAGGGSE
jgi:hypothetical protein